MLIYWLLKDGRGRNHPLVRLVAISAAKHSFMHFRDTERTTLQGHRQVDFEQPLYKQRKSRRSGTKTKILKSKECGQYMITQSQRLLRDGSSSNSLHIGCLLDQFVEESSREAWLRHQQMTEQRVQWLQGQTRKFMMSSEANSCSLATARQ